MSLNKPFDLSERLEDFAAAIILLYDKKPMSFAGEYLAKQSICSTCSAALNYGEALDAGTDKDKTYILRLSLKELRESLRNLNIQKKATLLQDDRISNLIDENDQLIRIIVMRIKNLT